MLRYVKNNPLYTICISHNFLHPKEYYIHNSSEDIHRLGVQIIKPRPKDLDLLIDFSNSSFLLQS
jgi:hypothetical protein